VPLDRTMTSTEGLAFLNSFDTRERSGRRNSKAPGIPYGKSFENNTLLVVHVRPYHFPNARNPRYVPNRPAIWVETGFEGNNPEAFSMAGLLIEYLTTHCAVHSKYDYFIVPLANPDGYGFDDAWSKTREVFNSSCTGVYLLNNFAHGDFESGDASCSDRYRGPFPMSADETHYQTALKSKMRNIVLSVTLTKRGAFITKPFAHSNESFANSDEADIYMEAFVNSTSGYSHGTYSTLHSEDFGAPLDYNQMEYKNSFNIAFDNGTQLTTMFGDFVLGFMGLVTYAKFEQNLAV